MMSVQEMWLEAISSGRSAASSPRTWTLKPRMRVTARCQCGGRRCQSTQPVRMATTWIGDDRVAMATMAASASPSSRPSDHRAEASAPRRRPLAEIAAHDKRAGSRLAVRALVVGRAAADLAEAEAAVEGARAGWSRRPRGTAPRRAGRAVRAAPRPSVASRGRGGGGRGPPRWSGSRPRRPPSRASTKPAGASPPWPVSRTPKPNTASCPSRPANSPSRPGPREILAMQDGDTAPHVAPPSAAMAHSRAAFSLGRTAGASAVAPRQHEARLRLGVGRAQIERLRLVGRRAASGGDAGIGGDVGGGAFRPDVENSAGRSAAILRGGRTRKPAPAFRQQGGARRAWSTPDHSARLPNSS